MREPDPVGHLTEIVEAIDRILSYVVDHDRASFVAANMVVDAVAMNLVVIGEAIRMLSADTLAGEPEIPWPRIVGMRNRIAHGYSGVLRTVVWDIVRDELTPLRDATLRMIANTGGGAP